jgi:hypothetical protein
MVAAAPISAKIIATRGTRGSILIGQVFVLLGFLVMLVWWKPGIPYWKVGLAYAFVGIGVGLAGPPTSNALTGSVPVKRVGMASGTADLQRDLGGAIMQSIFGALLTAGYTLTATNELSSSGQNVSDSVQSELTKSFASAADTASRYSPSTQEQIIAGAKTAFLKGDDWAYLAGIIAVALGMVLVFLKFPKHDEERALLASFQAADA